VRRTRNFSADPLSIRSARRFAVSALGGSPARTLEAVELMVSELATNSIRHAGTGFQLTVTRAGERIRIEVTDHAGGTPRLRHPGPEEPSGRGLQIVDMLSEQWGIMDDRAPGKTVWFTLR